MATDGHKPHCRKCEAAYQRKHYAENIEQLRRRKRKWMRVARKDLEYRQKCNERRRGNSKYAQRQKHYNKQQREKHFFRWRARHCGNAEVTAIDLARLWKKQHGRCVLSGRKLKRDAHLDHIIPVSDGGKTIVGNLRWLDPWVNIARRNLSDRDFLERCQQVVKWFG